MLMVTHELGRTKYRLNNVKLIIERIRTVDIDHSISDMDEIIAWALKARAHSRPAKWTMSNSMHGIT